MSISWEVVAFVVMVLIGLTALGAGLGFSARETYQRPGIEPQPIEPQPIESQPIEPPARDDSASH